MSDQFIMHGARDAVAQGWTHVDEQVRAIEEAVFENPSLAFDLAKTLVESACRTILSERAVASDKDDDMQTLFKLTKQNLPMLPTDATAEREARKSLEQTLNGLNTALQGVCELRNTYGFASHGTDGSHAAMESTQALLAAQSADAIVGFLSRVHRQEPAAPRERLAFDEAEDFNSYIDDANEPVRIFELEYRPSEVLYAVDSEAYRELWLGFDSTEASGATEPAAAGKEQS